MNPKLKKSLRELSIRPGRTFLVLFALVLGNWGLGTVLVSWSVLSRDLNENFQRTAPAHLVLESADFGTLSLPEFTERPDIEAAEFRDFSMQRIEVHPNRWVPMLIQGIDDFDQMSVGKVFYETGKRIPDEGSILIERNGRLVSNIDVNSRPRIRIGNETMQVPVSGICFDPAQPPATQDAMIFAYCSRTTYARITGRSTGKRLVIRLNQAQSAEDVEQMASKIIADLDQTGIHCSSVEIPLFNEHPHQWQLNSILFLIGSIGLLAFLMAAVLVSQLMRAILQSQIRQIGILKAIGATQMQIMQIYVVMLLVIGAVAGAISVPLATMSGMAFAKFVSGILNFDVLSSVSLGVYFGLGLASLLLPLLLSLPALLGSTRISVRRALHDYGITVKGSRKLSFLNRFPLSFTLRLALRNTARNSRRLTITIVTMALGVAIFSTGFNVRQSLWELLQGVTDELRYDVQVVLSEETSREQALFPFQSLNNVKTVEMWTGGRGKLQSSVLSEKKGAGIVALPCETEMLKLKIVQGRGLKPSAEPEIVMNHKAWEMYQEPAPGGLVQLNIRDTVISARLVGVATQFDVPKIYIDIAQYDALFNPSHRVNSLMFVTQKAGFRETLQLKRDIESAIVESDLDVLYVMSHAERVKIIYDHLDIILSVILFLSFLVLLVSGVGMASATGINIWERTREIGVMRAIGATPQMVYRQFVREGMIISVFSIALGMVIAYPLSQLAAEFFGNLILGDSASLAYSFSLTGFVVTLVVTLLFGWLASRIPARSGVRIATREALAYE